MATWMRAVEGKITDSFSGHKNRVKPSLNPGTDYGVPTGTPIKAIADGTITGVVPTFAGAGGRMIFQSFPSGHNADYLHLSRIDVVKGQQVKQGDIIGLSGASGLGKENGYGPHLHLSVRVGGQPTMGAGNIDFEALLAEQGETPAVAPAKAPAKAPVAPQKAPTAKPVAPTAKPASVASTGRTYRVVSGDNLTKIANQFRTTVPKLVALNGIKNANLIFAGQVLKID
jgi:murein DD-endopeptidase MepM/ murein hydrolase activator NlpD